MTKQTEAMKLALEAAYLAGFNASGEGYNGEYPFQDHNAHPAQDEGWCQNRDAYIRKALAEQPAQQEPVAWMWRCKPYCGWPEWSVSLKRPADSGRDGHRRTEGYEDVALYTSPPAQRKPLTRKQLADAWIGTAHITHATERQIAYARAIEAAHGIKEKNT